MSCVKSSLLHVYCLGSLPYRWWANRRANAARRAPVMIFTYHRIADDRANPWTMSHRTFARQIAWLRRHLEIVPLDEARRRIIASDNPRPCGVITFDDGYADNYEQAIPLLVREQVPCTYFVTLKNVLTGKPFPHDASRGDRFAPNTLPQLRSMSAAGIEIAAHGYNHANLGQIASGRELRREILVARQELQELLGRNVRYFAFPFGHWANLSQAAFAMAHDAGYEAACSAYGGYNYPGEDGFHLHRMPVDSCTVRLKNWATVDPRKRRVPRFAWARDEGSEPGCVSPVNESEPGCVGPAVAIPLATEPCSQHGEPCT
jgi:peptidoglycan/xylan/chitin deacetylase (PgdA/CDA1 family)